MTMAANLELLRVKERNGLRGFSNLFRKETRAWWGTRRWWINALLWTGLLCGLTAIMLFVPSEEFNQATEAEIAQAGGETAFILLLGLNVFFQFGVPVLAIGTIILAQDLIIGERQSGVAEWLLSKPVTRRAYVLAKLAATALAVFALLIGLPSVVAYGLLSLRLGTPFPLAPFLSAVGIMAVHSLFYLTLTLMLGTIFNNRGPILGIAVGSVLAGGMLGSLLRQLYYVTPWTLPQVALSTATGQATLAEMEIASLIATALWSVVFIIVAFAKFEKVEF
jgi:ABC-2 type transport system permease protein